MTTVVIDKVDRAGALKTLRARIRPRTGRILVAIDGIDGSGKTTFANDLGDLLTESGFTVIRITLDNYLNPTSIRYAQGRYSGKGYFEDSYDYDKFTDEVLEPLSQDGSGRYRTAAYDVSQECEVCSPWRVAPDDAVVIVDGLFMHRKAWCPESGRKLWDFSVWLDVPFTEGFRRLAERDGGSPNLDDPVNERHYQGQQLYLANCQPEKHADLVVDTSGPQVPADEA
ncbi:MAG: uridine kinase [Actinobacteria bacterium HGW-Actinobacteria-2]|nr:MAG: uridine kinase [Actinobacteria bacterium HGW-Actinobacteria-2]